jgi:hypothetical protein
MIEAIKQWFTSKRRLISANEFYRRHIEKLETQLESFVDVDSDEVSKLLCREILKLKDFSDLADLEGNPYADTPQDRANYCAVASSIYLSKPFQDIVKKIQYEQMMFTALQATGDAQSYMGRGTINGAALIEERFAALHAEHLKNTKPDPIPEGAEKFDLLAN